ncbi:hypothetical protein COP2_011850 [Malus domestica]
MKRDKISCFFCDSFASRTKGDEHGDALDLESATQGHFSFIAKGKSKPWHFSKEVIERGLIPVTRDENGFKCIVLCLNLVVGFNKFWQKGAARRAPVS